MVAACERKDVPRVTDAVRAAGRLVFGTWRAWLVPAIALGVLQVVGIRWAPNDDDWLAFVRLALGGDPAGVALGLTLLGRLVTVAVLVGLASIPLYLLIIERLASGVARPTDGLGGYGRALRRTLAADVAVGIFMITGIVGLVLFVLPGIWLTGRWLLWPVGLVCESLGPWAALRRSGQLVDGHWWWTNVVVSILLLAPPLVLALPVAALEAVLPVALRGLASGLATAAVAALVPAGLVVCARALQASTAGS